MMSRTPTIIHSKLPLWSSGSHPVRAPIQSWQKMVSTPNAPATKCYSCLRDHADPRRRKHFIHRRLLMVFRYNTHPPGKQFCQPAVASTRVLFRLCCLGEGSAQSTDSGTGGSARANRHASGLVDLRPYPVPSVPTLSLAQGRRELGVKLVTFENEGSTGEHSGHLDINTLP
jgi:hypothetical protein